MQELSPKKQEVLELIKDKYNDTLIRKGNIYVYDGLFLHIIDENKNGIKVSSTINIRHWLLLTLLIIAGITLGIVGIIFIGAIVSLCVLKSKRKKKSKLISLINA